MGASPSVRLRRWVLLLQRRIRNYIKSKKEAERERQIEVLPLRMARH